MSSLGAVHNSNHKVHLVKSLSHWKCWADGETPGAQNKLFLNVLAYGRGTERARKAVMLNFCCSLIFFFYSQHGRQHFLFPVSVRGQSGYCNRFVLQTIYLHLPAATEKCSSSYRIIISTLRVEKLLCNMGTVALKGKFSGRFVIATFTSPKASFLIHVCENEKKRLKYDASLFCDISSAWIMTARKPCVVILCSYPM